MNIVERLPSLNLEQLRRFLKVVERGSLAAAAPDLGLTQQALGAGISKLEDDMGVHLFDRGPGGATVVTAYGTLLIRHAKHLLAAADRAREEVLALRDARGGSVAIGIGEAFAPEVIAAAVADCHRSRPEIRISLVEDYSQALLDRLGNGELDFIAGADDARADDASAGDDLQRFPLYTAADIVIARAGHPLANRHKVSLRDLQRFSWLAPRSRASDAVRITEAFRSQNLDPPCRFIWTDAPNVGMALLLTEDFLFMTSPAQVTAQLQSGQLRALRTRSPSIQRRVGLVYRTDTRLNPCALLLMEDIRRRAHSHIAALSYAAPVNLERRISDAA